MTPTEQDNELREKVAAIIEYWDFSPLQDEDSRIERLNNEIIQLITADRKRVAMEARLDELESLEKYYVPYDDYAIYPAIESRIDELKAQQEEI